MGCGGSKEKAIRPCKGQAAKTGKPQRSAAPYEAAESLGSIDFAARSLKIYLEAGDSDHNTPAAQRYARQRFVHGVLAPSIAEVSSSPTHLGSVATICGNGTPRTPPAASFLGSLPLATSAPPQSTQLTPSRRGATEGLNTVTTSGTGKRRHCDEASRGQPLPGHRSPLEAPLSATAALYLDSVSRSPLCSLGPVVGTCNTVDNVSAASLHGASNAHAEASRVDSSEGDPLLTGTLGDASTMGSSILPRVRSRQPPASRSSWCQPVTPPTAQQPSPSLVLVPPSPSAMEVEAAAAPSESPRATQATLMRTAEAHHELQLESTEGFNSGVGREVCRRLFSLSPCTCHSPHAEESAVGASVSMHAAAGAPMQWRVESGGGADAVCSSGASDGRGEGTSEDSPATRSTQTPPAVPSAGQLSSSSSFSLPSASWKQKPQLSVAQMLSARPPHDSASPPLRLPAQHSISTRRPAPTTTGSVNVSAPAGSDAPDDVPLPRHSDLLSPRQSRSAASVSNAGGGGTGGVRTPLPPMPNSARHRSSVIHANGESLVNAPSVPVASETAALTQPRAPRWELSSPSAHHLATGSNSWLLSSANNTDDGSSDLAVGRRWSDGSAPSTSLPTNSELVRQIRQPMTHVKSILRKPGTVNTIPYGAAAVNSGVATSASHSPLMSLSASGGWLGGSVKANAPSPPRILVGSDAAVTDDKGAWAASASMTEPALQTDFVVLHRRTSDVDCVHSGAAPDDAAPLFFGSRSATCHGSPMVAWLRPTLFRGEGTTGSHASVVSQVSGESGSGFAADAVYGSLSANADETLSSAVADHSCEFVRRLGHPPATGRLFSPHAGQQRRWSRTCSDDSTNFGSASHGEVQALLPQLTVMVSSTSFMPDTVAMAGLTSDEPPPDIMLASPPPKRVHVVV
ncbi:hypothetical protein GH5_06764 [Leishmania sp. Ghana 2012 LV757]|uniref:hypothetical protein n=1 Tax=Leishmania sp. Ghana 2012 LV757 TaxID=2803181 RepID=UPI001B5C6073|nr:hypothetical protein GH5_06764 [Leishmania sp. Ghana 2012 LV757]